MKRFISTAFLIFVITLSLSLFAQQDDKKADNKPQYAEKSVVTALEDKIKLLEKRLEDSKIRIEEVKRENSDDFMGYQTHVSIAVTVLVTVVTILIAIVGIGFPLLINNRFAKEIERKIEGLDLKIKKSEAKMDAAIEQVKKDVEQGKKDVDESRKNAKTSNIYQLASGAYSETNIEKQIDLYTKIIDSKPEDVELLVKVYNNRGNAYCRKLSPDYDQAISDYSEAIRLKPDYADAYYNRGVAYYRKGSYDQAISDYSETIRLKPDYAEAYYNRGNAYDSKGSYDQAISDYTESIRLNPDDAEAYNSMAGAYRKKKELDKALEYIEMAINREPNNAYFLDTRGHIYFDMKEYDKALLDYNKAIGIDSSIGEIYYNRAMLYRMMSEIHKSKEEEKENYLRLSQEDMGMARKLGFKIPEDEK